MAAQVRSEVNSIFLSSIFKPFLFLFVTSHRNQQFTHKKGTVTCKYYIMKLVTTVHATHAYMEQCAMSAAPIKYFTMHTQHRLPIRQHILPITEHMPSKNGLLYGSKLFRRIMFAGLTDCPITMKLSPRNIFSVLCNLP